MNLEIISRHPKNKRFETPLLFVHGSCHAAWCWDENFLPYFAENGFDSYAVSLRGHGESEGSQNLNWTSVSDYVQDVLQAAINLPKTPAVVGHSLGGLVVQKFLEKNVAPAGILLAPSPVNGMFWSGLRLYFKNPFLFGKVFLKQDVQIVYGTPKHVKKNLFSSDADDAKIAQYTKRLGKESYRAFWEMIYHLPKPRLVKTPLLILGAENDIIVPPKEIGKTARSFNADYKIFPNVAHDLMLERGWQTVADFMIDWLKKTVK